jgi:tetratricopeptide (TPR) repeat protein
LKFIWSLGFGVWCFASAQAFSHARIGDVITNVELATASGSKQPFLTNAAANVFLFFKPGQEHSRALKELATCQRELTGRSVYWVAIVSDRFRVAEAANDLKEAGLEIPLLIDVGDALYGRLGVSLTPVIGIADRSHRLVAYEPFTKVNYTNMLRARIRHLLKEISDEELDQVLHPSAPTDDTEGQVARRWLKLAERAFASTNYYKALENVRASLAHDTNLVPAYVLLGRILSVQGQPAEANKAFDQALRLEPTNAAAQAGKQAR